MEIYVSGLHSGPNPSPGVGIARSLRLAYPNASIIGVDYSSRSTGIHWPDFDKIMLQRSWAELDLAHYANAIRALLSSGATWIPGLDLEVYWLAKELQKRAGLLSPPFEALSATRKPEIEAHRSLPFTIAPYINTVEPESAINAFCRRYGWRVWIKSPYYEARRVTNWQELKAFSSLVSETWSTPDLFLQAHIRGNEESIAFAAYKGELLQCICMKKKDVTVEGKTWAGKISLPPSEIVDALSRVVRDLEWTGGAELEFVRDIREQLWLIEWNPRFPAWIYGGTIAGFNLPADLLARSCGIDPKPTCLSSFEFARVALEIPVRPDFPLMEPTHADDSFSLTQKHPSGMPLLAKRLRETLLSRRVVQDRGLDEVPASMAEDLNSANLEELETPCAYFLPTIASSLMKGIGRLSARLKTERIKTLIAYSIKTNPDERILKLVRSHDFLVEAICADELSKALELGFSPQSVVLNGPAKAWPRVATERVLASFCDSLEELESSAILAREGRARSSILGVRIKPHGIHSRFGVLINNPSSFARLADLIRMIPTDLDFGIHFHIASSAFGIPLWWGVLDSAVSWALALEAITKRRVACLDLGGGWFPEDLLESEQTKLRLHDTVQRAQRDLQGLSQVILEPGKALSQSTFAIIMRILEVRRQGRSIEEIVVDGSIGEINQVQLYPHRLLFFDSKARRWDGLARGKSRILGRLCMENDILAENVQLPTKVCVGEFIAFCDSGAYDRSMAYTFGRGG